MLFISALEYTPDGRSLVSTIGERRFKVLERTTSDGYAMAKIQFISDIPVEGVDNISSLICQHYYYLYNYYVIIEQVNSVIYS